MAVRVEPGDCLDVMRRLATEGVQFDAICTDPPYHLTSIVKRFGKPGAAPAQVGSDGRFARASAGFMGKAWDGGDIAFDPETWALALRLLKPGGYLIAFGGSRTHHRMACAIEDAGFDIRDSLAWLYGQGFPKSHNVSKAIDRAGGVAPKLQAAILKRRREFSGLTRGDVAAAVGSTEASVRDWEEGRARSRGAALEYITPSDGYRTKIAELLGYSTDERVAVGVATPRAGDGTVIGLGHSGVLREGGNTHAAKSWDGWGTALKPAWEPIVLARRPLDGTVAQNVLQHGVGALNIDGCRIEADGANPSIARRQGAVSHLSTIPAAESQANGKLHDRRSAESYRSAGAGDALGRWPANLAHDGSDAVIAELPDSVSTGGANGGKLGARIYGEFANDTLAAHAGGIGDEGSVARFFYCAKATKTERDGSKHPTVKPVALMRWLVRLVTPPGGHVLDPFAGSGTTGVACLREGFDATLIEREPEYLVDLARRIGAPPELGEDSPSPSPAPSRQLSLFEAAS